MTKYEKYVKLNIANFIGKHMKIIITYPYKFIKSQ